MDGVYACEPAFGLYVPVPTMMDALSPGLRRNRCPIGGCGGRGSVAGGR